MKTKKVRLAIFAHYDKNKLIQDYVIYYLKELKKIVDNIIFVSDCNVKSNEVKKILPYITHSIIGKHGEYDFGSYKRGVLYAQQNKLLDDCDELIFCNDSCYGPLYTFKNVFDTMAQKECDFWGLTYNPVGITKDTCDTLYEDNSPHVQSFFLVFRPQVFNSEIFSNFINNIKKENDKFLIIIKYEIGLSKLLRKNGFRECVYCQTTLSHKHSERFHYLKLMLHDKNPLIKTSVIRQKKYINKLLKLIDKYTDYDSKLISKDLKYNSYYKRLGILDRIFSIFSDEDKSHVIIFFLGIKLSISKK